MNRVLRVVLYSTVDSVKDIVEKAKNFGVPIIKEPGPVVDQSQLGLAPGTASVDASCHKILSKVAYIADPDGHWIELVPRNIVSLDPFSES